MAVKSYDTYEKAKFGLGIQSSEVPIKFYFGETNLDSSLRYYYEAGLQPGGMMTTLLSGDFFGAYDRCHPNLKGYIGAVASEIREKLPRYCYGSPEVVENWIEIGGIRGWEALGNEWECPYTMHDKPWSKYFIKNT